MEPTSRTWPDPHPDFTYAIYDFGNGYGALHLQGTTTVELAALVPEGAITETGEPVVLPTESFTLTKNELHPLELPRFDNPIIRYQISPEIHVTEKTLQPELAKLKEITNG